MLLEFLIEILFHAAFERGRKKKKQCNSFVVFYRGLVGYRSVFSSDTRGTGFMHRAFLSMHVLLKIFVHVVLEIF